jgi:hypothetical protein
LRRERVDLGYQVREFSDGGYGETAWQAKTGTVFWNAADWTTGDEAR